MDSNRMKEKLEQLLKLQEQAITYQQVVSDAIKNFIDSDFKTPIADSEIVTVKINNNFMTKQCPGETRFKVEKRISDNSDGTINVEFVGMYRTIKEISDKLGFSYGKTYHIYSKKLDKDFFINKVELKQIN